MKLLLLLGAVLLVIWLMRVGRSRPGKRNLAGSKAEHPRAEAALEEMVACRQCGIHLPTGDALSGPSGEWFCCAAHRDGHSRTPSN
jgi:uncharacterized protein